MRFLRKLAGACAAMMLAVGSCYVQSPAVPGTGGAGAVISSSSAACVGSSSSSSSTSGAAVSSGGGQPSFDTLPSILGPATYWGGPVMLGGTTTVYFIWYGDWSTEPSSGPVLDGLIDGFSASSYSRILEGYYQVPQPPLVSQSDSGAGGVGTGGQPAHPVTVPDGGLIERLTHSVVRGPDVRVGSPLGDFIFDDEVLGVVTAQLKAGTVPYDPDGVYMVLTSTGTQITDGTGGGFCYDYCGWHRAAFVDGMIIKYALVGDANQCLDGCSIQSYFGADGIQDSPNGDWGVDSMASVIVHELFETMTDPAYEYSLAWTDPTGDYEIADMCAWRFDPTYPTDAGSRANVRFGERDYLVQQMWVNSPDAGCQLHP